MDTVMKFDVKKSNMVKCIAIILMLMHHLFGCFTKACQRYGVYSLYISWDSITKFSGAAKVCVATYVFLTAYGITISYNKNKDVLCERKNYERFCISLH